MIDLLKQQRSHSILGLAFDGNRLEGVILRRNGESVEVRQAFSVTLALNPLNADPQLLGRELRNHLDRAEVRERRCAVCVPLGWVMGAQTKVPAELGAADIESFLQIEAERGFHSGPDTLSISNSLFKTPPGEQFATLLAIPRSHLTRLEEGLRAARLSPVSFSLGVPAMENPATAVASGILTLAVNTESIDLQVASGGGIVALRTLEHAVEAEGAVKRIDADFIAREIRITLGQLPNGVRESVNKIKVIGRGDAALKLVNELSARFSALGLKIELIDKLQLAGVQGQLAPEFAASPALALGTNILRGNKPSLEFLPPRTNAWKELTSRISGKKLGWVGAVAGSIVLLVILAFLVQQIQLSYLQSKWNKMEPQVKELTEIQQNIRLYRPWFDESFRSLTILKKVTEAFPEDGQVSAKTLEIRDPASVTCTGVARDNQSFLKMLDKLRASPEVADLKIEQVRGQSPLQFTFNFQWEANNGN